MLLPWREFKALEKSSTSRPCFLTLFLLYSSSGRNIQSEIYERPVILFLGEYSITYIWNGYTYFMLRAFIFFRGLTLKGASAGLAHMFYPKMESLLNPSVWMDAANQVLLKTFPYFELPVKFLVHTYLSYMQCNWKIWFIAMVFFHSPRSSTLTVWPSVRWFPLEATTRPTKTVSKTYFRYDLQSG